MRGTPRRPQARQKSCPLRANGAWRPAVPPADRRRRAAGVSAVTFLWGWFPCCLASSLARGLSFVPLWRRRLCGSGVRTSLARGLSSSLSGFRAGGAASSPGVLPGPVAPVCFGVSALLVVGGALSVGVSFAVSGCLSGVWVRLCPVSACAGWRRGCRSSASFRLLASFVGVLSWLARLPARLPFGLRLGPEGSSRGGGFPCPAFFFMRKLRTKN